MHTNTNIQEEGHISENERAQLEEIIELQSKILADTCSGKDTRILFDELCLAAEKLSDGSLASIMVFDKEQGGLFVRAAPSVPQQAIDDLNGLKVGIGSCGNAVLHNAPQYVASTMTDERWADIRAFATTYNIQACWSCPIRNESDQPVGSFALMSFESREPSGFHKRLLSSCASIAGILFQRLHHEAEKVQNELRHRSMIENSADAIFLHDESGCIFDVNQMACDYLGYERDELIGMYCNDIEMEPEPGRDFTQELDDQQSVTFDGIHGRKDGAYVPVEIRLRRYDVDGEKKFIALVRDTSERKRIENIQQTSSKLESIGVLAGGLAHDFNNLLGSVLGNINLATMHIEDSARATSYLQKATNASRRAADLTQQLLTFSKGGDPVRKNSDIKEVIRQSCDFTMHGSNIDVIYDFADSVSLVEIDSGQISQVIQNLVINARQAMPTGGTLTVTCHNTTVSNLYNIGVEPGDYVMIGVRDEGVGIPDNIIRTIFDPYFTTKQEGSGLGLALSYSIVSKHNGVILVDSEPGLGSLFSIYLPASSAGRTTADKTQETVSHAVDGAAVLVMDDDEMIREICGDMLESMGHRVLLAEDGERALELVKDQKNKGEAIDLMIMDLTVPAGMGGQEAASKILQLDPDARLIVSSGYSNDPVMANYTDFGFCNAISKPYTSEELEKVIRTALG